MRGRTAPDPENCPGQCARFHRALVASTSARGLDGLVGPREETTPATRRGPPLLRPESQGGPSQDTLMTVPWSNPGTPRPSPAPVRKRRGESTKTRFYGSGTPPGKEVPKTKTPLVTYKIQSCSLKTSNRSFRLNGTTETDLQSRSFGDSHRNPWTSRRLCTSTQPPRINTSQLRHENTSLNTNFPVQ